MNKPSVTLLKEIYGTLRTGNEWVDKLPHELSGAFFDNPYVNGLNEVNELLIKNAFGNHWQAVDWFLLEWQPGFSSFLDGVEYTFNTPEEYYEYLIEHGGWEV